MKGGGREGSAPGDMSSSPGDVEGLLGVQIAQLSQCAPVVERHEVSALVLRGCRGGSG